MYTKIGLGIGIPVILILIVLILNTLPITDDDFVDSLPANTNIDNQSISQDVSDVSTADNSVDTIVGVGPLGSEHSHAAILVKILGDSFDFSIPAYQIKSSWIHFEGRDGSTIHKHATGATLGFLFDTLGLGLDDQCYAFQDGRKFCTSEEYSLKFYINSQRVNDIRNYEVQDGDRILISYGNETQHEINQQLAELYNQQIIK